MNRAVGTGLGVLVVLLIVAAVVLSAGRSERVANPSVTNDLPSGLSAFAELLRRDGYAVVVDRRERVDARPGDLVVCARILWGSASMPDRLRATITPFVAAGGKILHLTLGEDFAVDSLNAQTLDLTPGLPGDARMRVVAGPVLREQSAEPREIVELDTEAIVRPAWTDPGGLEHTRAFVVEQGAGMIVRDALPLTNRFLGRESNAPWGLGLVRRLQPPGGRVVFAEASFGNVERQGFLGTVGAWAVAIQWQLILLALVVAFSLGRRFGLPTSEVPAQRGARELVDAVATTLQRGRRAPFAARLVGEAALDHARGLLGLAPGVAREEVLRRLSDEDRVALERCLDAESESAPERECRRRAADLVERAAGWTRAGLMERRPET